jgi:hypothetical protein
LVQRDNRFLLALSSGRIVSGRGTVRSFFPFPSWTVKIPVSKLIS